MSSRPQRIHGLVQNLFFDLWVVWVEREDLVANVNGLDEALGLQVVEGELEPNGSRSLVLQLPRLFVQLRRVFVRCLLLPDAGRRLPGAAAALVVFQTAVAEVLRQIELGFLNVHVGKKQVPALEVVCQVVVVRHLGNPLERVPGLGRRLFQHERRRHAQQRGQVVLLRLENVDERLHGVVHVRLGPRGQPNIGAQHADLQSEVVWWDERFELFEQLIRDCRSLRVLRSVRPVVPNRLPVRVQVQFDHVHQRRDAPLAVAPSEVEELDGVDDVVGVARVEALAKVETRVGERSDVRPLGRVHEMRHLVQLARAPQEPDQLGQRAVVVRRRFQDAPQFQSRAVELLPQKEDVCEQHVRFVVLRLDSSQREADGLALLQIAPFQMQPGQVQEAGRVQRIEGECLFKVRHRFLLQLRSEEVRQLAADFAHQLPLRLDDVDGFHLAPATLQDAALQISRP
mmetsp:Transcript_10715/g.35613  ORF Transcript_10715/g.35613 Transcript_10715/m.35613 type:complete len:456 (-) Transcript_10715:2883-4250(-)